jgi:DNA-binding transcriptional regulator YdaS (Cro superfamily)
MKTLNPIKIWMRAASVAEQTQMAELAGTTRAMLYQYAGGFRETSSERAVQIEQATMQMAKSTKDRLPVIYRTDLSSACAQCHFARKCLGAKAEFALS